MLYIILSILILSVLSNNLRDRQLYLSKFEDFLKTNNKIYSNQEEYNYRFNIFINNARLIEQHNNKKLSYSLAINKFADLTKTEFVDRSLAKGKDLNKINRNNKQIKYKTNINLPDNIDWTTKGAVSIVKDQGACGSCWSFGTTGALESAYFLKNNKMIILSQQQLVDCSGSYGNEGCNGGITGWAYEYIKDNGICLEEDYPYHARDEKCKSTTCTKAVDIKDYVIVDTNEIALAEAVSEHPVAIDFDATLIMFYDKGIVDGECPIELTHSVLAVGYGEENGIKYWKMKNSWGGSWGEKGYFRIRKDSGKPEGECGLVLNSVYPVL